MRKRASEVWRRSLIFPALCMMLIVACSDKAASQNGMSSSHHSALSSADLAELEVGEEYSPCADCPVFVRVPEAPGKLRRVLLVSKFELTWRNYLQAVGDGSCTVKNPNRPPFRRSQPDLINANLDRFNIDWPVTILGPDDVTCYINWLSIRVPAKVVIPTFDEWKWFASAGRPTVRYSWGDDPKQAVGALAPLDGRPYESTVDARRPTGSASTGRDHHLYARYLHALKIGLFQPNPWGLHDLMGNASELTATVEPYVSQDGKRDRNPRVVVAGSGFYDKRWVDEGLDLKIYSIVSDGQYSLFPGVRLIIVS